MTGSPPDDVTRLLTDLSNGDPQAMPRLLPRIYAELHSMAARAMRQERPDHTLQVTALVNEAYLRLVDQTRVQWRHRAHFFAVAAQLMRRILVDHARAHQATKRGGLERARVSLDEAAVVAAEPGSAGAVDLAALDDALNRLAALDPQQVRIVELRYFGDLTVEQTAEVLGISPATVKRDWAMAKGWLQRELGRD